MLDRLKLSLTACVPLTPFERQDLLIKEIGEEDAQQRMTEVLKRSFNPGATEVKYEPNRMLVTLKLSGFQRGRLEIEYARLWKVDPYRNGRVFVWHTDRSFHSERLETQKRHRRRAAATPLARARGGIAPGAFLLPRRPAPPGGLGPLPPRHPTRLANRGQTRHPAASPSRVANGLGERVGNF